MALVLDTGTLEPRERAEAVRHVMRTARVPATLIHEDEDRVRARMDLWPLGGDTTLLHRTGSGLLLRRNERQVRRVAEERFGFVVVGPGRWSFAQHDGDRREQARGWGMLAVDQAAPYEFGRYGDGSVVTVNIDRAALGLPRALVRRAAHRLASSPLHGLVRDHLLGLARDGDAVPPGPAAELLGSATTDLLRALVTTALPGELPRPDDDAAALVTQTRMYVRRHFADPALTPERIARAHAVSVRRLYAAWQGSGQTLAGHIMAVRLRAARVLLAAPAAGPPAIGAVGRACGFVDMTHFARRFRQAYGMSPREFRHSQHSSAHS